ncbi:hypothetical protein CsSME_00041995 [Camellia sinensis var. sinensis]
MPPRWKTSRERTSSPLWCKHFTIAEIIRDIISCISNGLTILFAIATSLFGANASSIILTASVISIGLVRYY